MVSRSAAAVRSTVLSILAASLYAGKIIETSTILIPPLFLHRSYIYAVFILLYDCSEFPSHIDLSHFQF
ncbi:MAG: hypothetical protein M5U10_09940 [Candidatus Methanoperedens sp.]|nr:hypothetical protein [Candidatus Methanoperedens sp.]